MYLPFSESLWDSSQGSMLILTGSLSLHSEKGNFSFSFLSMRPLNFKWKAKTQRTEMNFQDSVLKL